MSDKLNKYNDKRDFNKTDEPSGKIEKTKQKLRFVVQHHMASREHYDLRLEWEGTLKSWAVPKGPSYNTKDRRLAVEVEDHPISYRTFEGTIPKGQYGGGTVMVWDEGYWEPLEDPDKGFNEGSIKFILKGKKLHGQWALVRMKDDNWLFIKDKDEFSSPTIDITEYNKSVKTNRTMSEIEKGVLKKETEKNNTDADDVIIESVKITNPDKVLFADEKITKKEVIQYYQKVAGRILPYLKNRLISTIRCPDGTSGSSFFKKHFGENPNEGLGMLEVPSSSEKDDYYYIKNISGLISEVQMNSIEFHTWGSNIKNIDKPDIMVFDLDPDEGMNLEEIREGVKDLKSILDELSLVSFLKTSGGKGYHIVVPFKSSTNWELFRKFSKNIAVLMEEKWPDKYTSNVRMINRKGKIFVDWIRNTKGATSVAPYSVRAKKKATVSMPIAWSELDKVEPNSITMSDVIKRLRRKDPWENFFKVDQKLK